MQKLLTATFIFAALGLSLGLIVGEPALALDPAAAARDGTQAAGAGGARRLEPTIQIVVNAMLFILGAISVVMIIFGGIKYTISNGDTTQITSAKNTIMYAVIGLVVAMLAYAIVNFVVGQLAR